MTKPFWKLNDLEYFEAPGLSTLVFHETYPEGKQGGIEIIQHGERVAACGDVRLEPAPGQWRPMPEVGAREVDPATGTARVPLRFAEADIAYTVEVRPEGEALRVAVNLEAPLPPEWEGKVGLNLELELRSATVHSEGVAICAPYNAEIEARGSRIQGGTAALRFSRRPRRLELRETTVQGKRDFRSNGCTLPSVP